jgi:hypothetical protein
LNQADLAGLERGYYENLLGGDRLNGELWALYMNMPLDWNLSLVDSGVARPTEGFIPYALVPSVRGRFKSAAFETNRWGMHDKEYAKERPADCYRIALLGASHTMGSGVGRMETFEAQLENRLNTQPIGAWRCYEILNFGVYGYSPLYQIEVLRNRVSAFDPQAVFYTGHPGDAERVARLLADSVKAGRVLPYEPLRKLVRESGANGAMQPRIVDQRLASAGRPALEWLYAELVSTVREHGACAAFIYMPMIPDFIVSDAELRLATTAGFTPLDLRGVYDVADRNALWVAKWDAHPNASANGLVAARLYELLAANPAPLSCARAR